MTQVGSQTLERGLTALVEISRAPQGLTTAEVGAACGLHRSVIHRLLVSLQRMHFVTRDEEGRYTVGDAARGLVTLPPSLQAVAEPVLQRLATTIDATASLVEVTGDAAVTTVVAEPPTDGPRFSYRLGSHDPLDRGAGGIAALASGPPQNGELPRVAKARAVGYVMTAGELNHGAFGLAAPLPGWPVRAALNIVTARADVEAVALEPLLRAAAEIGQPT